MTLSHPSQAVCFLTWLVRNPQVAFMPAGWRGQWQSCVLKCPHRRSWWLQGWYSRGPSEAKEKFLGNKPEQYPPVPLIPECLLNGLLWTGAKLSLFDLLSLALHPVSESGIDPDLNRSWIAATISCKSFLSHYSSAETERKTPQPTMLPQSRWHR